MNLTRFNYFYSNQEKSIISFFSIRKRNSSRIWNHFRRNVSSTSTRIRRNRWFVVFCQNGVVQLMIKSKKVEVDVTALLVIVLAEVFCRERFWFSSLQAVRVFPFLWADLLQCPSRQFSMFSVMTVVAVTGNDAPLPSDGLSFTYKYLIS